MGLSTAGNSEVTTALLRRAVAGDQPSRGELLQRHRPRLERMVLLRLDPRLHGRLSLAEVLGAAFAEATARLPEYVQEPVLPFYLWLRFLTGQKLLDLHRQHLGRLTHDSGRETALFAGPLPVATSAVLAAQLVGHDPRPSEVARRAERKARLQEALNRMDAGDREVLTLRHFEQLTNEETARVLGVPESAASKGYLRALRHLKKTLADPAAGPEGE